MIWWTVGRGNFCTETITPTSQRGQIRSGQLVFLLGRLVAFLADLVVLLFRIHVEKLRRMVFRLSARFPGERYP